MNKPISAEEMKTWTKEQWQKCQDEAWDRLKEKLEKPETLAVLKRLKEK